LVNTSVKNDDNMRSDDNIMDNDNSEKSSVGISSQGLPKTEESHSIDDNSEIIDKVIENGGK